LSVSQKNILWESAIYEASLRDLLSVVDQYSQGIHTLFLIGHNPGLDQLTDHLSKDPLPLSHAGKLMTTGAVAVLNYGAGPISTQSHHANLKHLIRPKEL
jgi:phosphohistidine phosphatase